MEVHFGTVRAAQSVAVSLDPEGVGAVAVKVGDHSAGAVDVVGGLPGVLFPGGHLAVLQHVAVGGEGVLGQAPVDLALVVHAAAGQVNHGRVWN